MCLFNTLQRFIFGMNRFPYFMTTTCNKLLFLWENLVLENYYESKLINEVFLEKLQSIMGVIEKQCVSDLKYGSRSWAGMVESALSDTSWKPANWQKKKTQITVKYLEVRRFLLNLNRWKHVVHFRIFVSFYFSHLDIFGAHFQLLTSQSVIILIHCAIQNLLFVTGMR